MAFSTKRIFLSLLAAWALAGCNANQPSSSLKAEEPTNPFDVSKQEVLPERAAEILGLRTPSDPSSSTARCTNCHSDFRSFDGIEAVNAATYPLYNCFNSDISKAEGARDVVSCLAEIAYSDIDQAPQQPLNDAQIEEGIRSLSAAKLGLFTAAVDSKIFANTFAKAGFSEVYKEWKGGVFMPYRGTALKSSDFQIVLNWMLMDMPEKEKIFTHDGPQTCESSDNSFIGANVRSHVKKMSEDGEGWNFVNLARGVPMFACTAENECFKNKQAGKDVFPLVKGWLNRDLSGEVRQLHTINERTSYWTRSSADGRFVAYGAIPNSKVVDLAPLLKGKPEQTILVEAEFDPAFTPDNQAFIFQGEPHGTRFCNQSVLGQAGLTTLDFKNPGCSSSDLRIGLYQAMGTSLNSGDIVTVAGGFKSDEGQTLFQDSAPMFSSSSEMEISRIRRSDSIGFEKVSSTTVPTPYTANWMLSPSQGLLMGTISASSSAKRARHGGYHLVRSDAPSVIEGKALPALTSADSALLCVGSGEKPTISFDERFLVYYSYASHAAVVSSLRSSADLYIIDLLGDGKAIKLTNMPNGMYAQFPHFRSDGWLYFTVYDARSDQRSVVATDVVLNFK